MRLSSSFNAARGFVCGARRSGQIVRGIFRVSLPHAALLVVQEEDEEILNLVIKSFNAARGFVGGAS